MKGATARQRAATANFILVARSVILNFIIFSLS
jgi:hypothetical protein